MKVDAYAELWTPARTLLCLAVKARRSASDFATLRRLHTELGNDAVAELAAAHGAESIVAHGLADAGISGAPWDAWHEAIGAPEVEARHVLHPSRPVTIGGGRAGGVRSRLGPG